MAKQRLANSKMTLLNNDSQRAKTKEEPSLGDLALSAIEFSDFIKREVVEIHRQVGEQWMVQSHFDLLQHLSIDGDLTMSQLTECINRTGPTVTTLVKKLKVHGYLTTYKTPEDERINKVRLTAKGSKQAEWAKNKLNHYEASVSETIDKDRVKDAIKLLSDVRDLLANG